MTNTANLFFDFEDDSSQLPGDFLTDMFFETCRSTDDSHEDLDSFKEFVLAFVSEGNLDPIHQGFNFIYENKNIERMSVLVNFNCLNHDEKTKALRVLANSNKPISSLINVDNVSETIVALFNGGRETEAFELINRFEVKKINTSAIKKDDLNHILKMTLNDFSLIHIFVLLFNSSIEPIDMLFDFIDSNLEDVRLIDYFLTIQSQSLKEFSPSIKQRLSKILPNLHENIEVYELIIKNLDINFNDVDDYKIGYYAVESANQPVLSMLADNNYYTSTTLPHIAQACIKFNKPKLFTYFLNTYTNILIKNFIEEDLTNLGLKDSETLFPRFDSFGIIRYLKDSNIIYKDFFVIYINKLEEFIKVSNYKQSFSNVFNLIVKQLIDKKQYLSLILQDLTRYQIKLDSLVDYFYMKDDFEFLSPFIPQNYVPSFDLGISYENIELKPLDEKWFDFVKTKIVKNDTFYSFMFGVCAYRSQYYLNNFSNKEVYKKTLDNLISLLNQKDDFSKDFVNKNGYSHVATQLVNPVYFHKNIFGNSPFKTIDLDILKSLISKRANLWFVINEAILQKNVDFLLFAVANAEHQKLVSNRIIGAILFHNLLYISNNEEVNKVFAFEAFKTLWDNGVINIKSVTKVNFENTVNNEEIYKFLIDKNIYKDFDSRDKYQETLFNSSLKSDFEEMYSYNKVTEKVENKTQLKLQKEEEDFSFMKKDNKKEKTGVISKLMQTTLPYYIVGGVIIYALYLLKLL